METGELVGKWVSIQWHAEDDPMIGKVVRPERGYLVMETPKGDEVPFIANSLYSMKLAEEPVQEPCGYMASIWAFMNAHKLKTLFVSGVVIDFWANWYSYAIVHDWIVLQAFLGFFLPILNFPFIHWFIDEPNIRERFKMTLVTAFSMMLGSTLMLVMIRFGLGVGKDFIP